jgi:transposase InsO family protein
MRRDIKPGLLHHSDRDGLYNSTGYKRLLKQYGMVSSMSRKGNCYDNACVESFFASLKTEMVAFERFKDRDEAKEKLFVWIETFYNRSRRHSYLQYQSPMEYESDNKNAM